MAQTVSSKKLSKKGLIPCLPKRGKKPKNITIPPFAEMWREDGYWRLPGELFIRSCGHDECDVEIDAALVYRELGLKFDPANAGWYKVLSYPSNLSFFLNPSEGGQRCEVRVNNKEVLFVFASFPGKAVAYIWRREIDKLMSTLPFLCVLEGALREAQQNAEDCYDCRNENGFYGMQIW